MAFPIGTGAPGAIDPTQAQETMLLEEIETLLQAQQRCAGAQGASPQGVSALNPTDNLQALSDQLGGHPHHHHHHHSGNIGVSGGASKW